MLRYIGECSRYASADDVRCIVHVLGVINLVDNTDLINRSVLRKVIENASLTHLYAVKKNTSTEGKKTKH